ncbi:tyrosine-type recombinase/integrase [Ralstonia pseudosolanacearum]|uniref:Integrase / recombinase protein n=2 Tax=Ralstonia pseudosolanacearum TaxID=1310165 RepID=Q8XG24_RALN1|nr:tyrosine-type recombinase/integrase [Ralstonia pseudosolanacearum]AST27417.1 integrase [Ralstonia pseudosolanacearum]AST29913.1 integrase [Ralstonia pseudosolanacearum]MCQ4678593.1 tyrosine-type recombinase/integrase [Ralstonia pseudosolanacearum]MCQ4681148.1 tyrosine-type recombinase/integrase [Ralstonia pseudosolanacearum]CAD15549.1 putative integrase / recombinase protein [Ralstonia pseudosolanacearum GMI1000]
MVLQVQHPSIPKRLHGAVLVDGCGLPRYWVSVWAQLALADLAELTRLRKLYAIERLYAYADELLGAGALDDALFSLDEARLGSILEGWFVSIRNQHQITDSDQKRWRAGLDFVVAVTTWLGQGTRHENRLARLDARWQRLNLLYGQLQIQRPHRTNILRALPAVVVEAMYALLDPESDTNPFKGVRTRWRVFTAFVLMLHQGLRRGELLLLNANAIKSGLDARQQRRRYWINVSEQGRVDTDPRYSKPGIKTADSIRQVPVSELTANLVQCYVDNYRGRPDHPYLLNAQTNTPLSTESLTKLFERISTALPAAVLAELEDRTGKTSITPHDLRHTCAVVRLNQLLSQGDSMDEALQKMRTFFGWSHTSDQPANYARAVFEDRLAVVWNNVFDDRVAVLRALPPGLRDAGPTR